MAPKMHGMHGLHIEGRIGHAEHDLETAIQVHGQDAFHMRKDHQRELMEKRQEHAMVARRIAHSDPKQLLFEKMEQHAKGNLLEVYKLIHKGHGKEVTFSEFRTMADETFNLGLSEAEYAGLFAELDATNSGKLQLDELMKAFAPAFAAPKMTSFDVVRPDTGEVRKREIVRAHVAKGVAHVAATAGGVDTLFKEKLRQLHGEQIQSLFRRLHRGPGSTITFAEFCGLVRDEFQLGLSEAEHSELFAHIHTGEGDEMKLDELRDFISGPTKKHRIRTRLDGSGRGAVADVLDDDGEEATVAAGMGLRLDNEALKMKQRQAYADAHGPNGPGASGATHDVVEARRLLQRKMEEHAGGDVYKVYKIVRSNRGSGGKHEPTIEYADFRLICRDFNMGLSEGEMRLLFNDLDRNKSGTLDMEELIVSFSAIKSTNFENERPDTAEERHREYLKRFANAERAHVSANKATQLATLLREKLVMMSSELPRLFRRVKRQGADGISQEDFGMVVNDMFSMGLTAAETKELFETAASVAPPYDVLRLDDLRAFVNAGDTAGATSLDATPAAARAETTIVRMAAAQSRVDDTVGALGPSLLGGDKRKLVQERLHLMGSGQGMNVFQVFRRLHTGHGKEITYSEFASICRNFNLHHKNAVGEEAVCGGGQLGSTTDAGSEDVALRAVFDSMSPTAASTGVITFEDLSAFWAGPTQTNFENVTPCASNEKKKASVARVDARNATLQAKWERERRRQLADLSVDEVGVVLRQRGLGAWAAALQVSKVNGVALERGVTDADLAELGINIRLVRKRILELVEAIRKDGIVLVPMPSAVQGANVAALAAATAAAVSGEAAAAAAENAAAAAAAAAATARSQGGDAVDKQLAKRSWRTSDTERLQSAHPTHTKPPFGLAPGARLQTTSSLATDGPPVSPIKASGVRPPSTVSPRSPQVDSPISPRSPRSPTLSRGGAMSLARTSFSPRHTRIATASSSGGRTALSTRGTRGGGLGMSRGGTLGDDDPVEARMMELCHELDVDRSGLVSAAEFVHALAVCGYQLSDAQAGEIIAKLPLDDEGMITYGELPLLDVLPSPELLKRPASAAPTPFSGGAGATGGDGAHPLAYMAPSQLLPAAISGSELGSRVNSGVHAAAAKAVAAKLYPVWSTLNKRLMAADRDAGGQRPGGDGVPTKLVVNPSRAGTLPWATVDVALRASAVVLEPAERAWIIATFAGTFAGRNNTSNNGLAATTTAEVAYPQLMQHVAMSGRGAGSKGGMGDSAAALATAAAAEKARASARQQTIVGAAARHAADEPAVQHIFAAIKPRMLDVWKSTRKALREAEPPLMAGRVAPRVFRNVLRFHGFVFSEADFLVILRRFAVRESAPGGPAGERLPGGPKAASGQLMKYDVFIQQCMASSGGEGALPDVA